MVSQSPTLLQQSTSSPANSMIHHKDPQRIYYIIHKVGIKRIDEPYGVSPGHKILPAPLMLKRFNEIRSCLSTTIGLSAPQREVVLRLLRLYVYYGKVYPKAQQIIVEPGCSKATFWRTIKMLQDQGLITVVNRYIKREHAQISNVYRLDKLLIVIARYLYEHGVGVPMKFITGLLRLDSGIFWRQAWSRSVNWRLEVYQLPMLTSW